MLIAVLRTAFGFVGEGIAILFMPRNDTTFARAQAIRHAGPSLSELIDAYWDAETPEAETEALNDLRHYYPEGTWGPLPEPAPVAGPTGASPAAGERSPEPRPAAGQPNLEFPDPDEITLWPDWLVMMHAANLITFTPETRQVVDELRIRSYALQHNIK